MDNPYEQQQTALVSRIINNVEKLNEAIVELSRSLQVSSTEQIQFALIHSDDLTGNQRQQYGYGNSVADVEQLLKKCPVQSGGYKFATEASMTRLRSQYKRTHY